MLMNVLKIVISSSIRSLIKVGTDESSLTKDAGSIMISSGINSMTFHKCRSVTSGVNYS